MHIRADNPLRTETFSADKPLHYVFDLDDTLKPTAEFYTAAKEEWARYTQEQLAPFWSKYGLVRAYRRIDTERQKEQFYDKSRFGGSLAITYRNVADHAESFYRDLSEDEAEDFANQYVPEALRDRFHYIIDNVDEVFSEDAIDVGADHTFDLGWQVVDKSPEEYASEGFIGEEMEESSAEDVLAYLANEDRVELHLLTAGPEEVQWPKIEGLELDRFIPEENLYVVQYDKTEKLQEIAETHGKNRTVMIGNSLTSDMEPSQELDIGHVYFHYHDWEHDRFENGVDTDHPKFMSIHGIAEMIDLHHELT